MNTNLAFRSDCEDNLVRLGKWGILAAQIPGYLPLSIECTPSGKVLSAKGKSIPFIYTLVFGIATIVWSVGCVYYFDRTLYTKNIGKTPAIAFFTLRFLVVTTGPIIRISNLFKKNKILEFWQKTVDLVEVVTFVSSEHCTPVEFEAIKTPMRNRGVFIVVLGLIYEGFGLANLISKTDLDNNAFIRGLQRLISLQLFIHLGYSLWMLLFVQIYTKSYIFIERLLSEADQSYGKTNRIEKRISDALRIYEILEDQVRYYNETFGMDILMETALTLAVILADIFYVVLGFSGFSKKVFSYPYPILILIYIILYYHSLHNITNEATTLILKAQVFLSQLQRMPLEILTNKGTVFKIQAVLSRTMHSLPVISAGNYFVINKNLITSFFGAIMTYLIVLVQLWETD